MKLIINEKLALSYAEYGNPNGFPILVQHGLIASIRDGNLFERLTTAGARMICIARPGYGESSPYEINSIGEWGQLVTELTRELRLTQFDVLGMSSGAPYSYAIAWALPEVVRKVYIFSGIPAMYDDQVLALWPFPIQKNADLDEMKKLAYELFLSNLTSSDLLKDDIKDSMANDCFGLALDFRLRCMDWGFKLSEVRQKVFMRHARFDGNVPLSTAELTAALLPKAALSVDDNDIHFSKETLDAFFESTVLPQLPK